MKYFQMWKWVWMTIFLTLISNTLIMYIAEKGFVLIKWLDTLFILSLIMLVLGCILIVKQGKVFDLFIHNFKHFWYKNSKTERIIREVEKREEKDFIKKNGHIQSYTIMITLSGLVLVVCSIILSLIIS